MDCLAGMKSMPDNSVDSIITDPPYGLSFMGKKWDYEVPKVEIWKECLRVLKPGGYLLSFAGTRTQHRMAVNIEDAGFEIRDMICWVYGCLSEDTEILTLYGWEHYHKNIYKYPLLTYDIENDIYKWEIPKKWSKYQVEDTCYRIKSDKTDQLVSRNHRVPVEQEGKLIFKFAETLECQENIPFLETVPNMQKTISNIYKGTSNKKKNMFSKMQKLFSSIQKEKTSKISNNNKMSNLWKGISNKKEQTSQVLFPFMQWKSKGDKLNNLQIQQNRHEVSRNRIKGREESCLERGGNLLQEEGQLWKVQDKIYSLSKRIYSYGSEGWLCNGTPIINSKETKQVSIKNRNSPSQRPQSREQSNRQFNIIQEQPRTQDIRGYGITRAKVTKEKYSGLIFCPTVSTGCFVARRKGKIFITGNSGFPKSHNVGVAVDKLQKNEREHIGVRSDFSLDGAKRKRENHDDSKINIKLGKSDWDAPVTKGTSEWEGWGTALKPALEPITMARKPLSEKNVALNVLKWGTGGINIDESRIPSGTEHFRGIVNCKVTNNSGEFKSKSGFSGNEKIIKATDSPLGRFPANLIHDNSEEVRKCFPDTKSIKGNPRQVKNIGSFGSGKTNENNEYSDSGNSSRYFKSIIYQPKASKKERNKGLNGKWFDSLEIILYSCDDSKLLWKDKITIQEEKKVKHLKDMEQSAKKAIEEYGIKNKKDIDLNIILFGKKILEKYLKDINFTTKMGLNSITTQQILNWLHHSITKESTQGANLELMDGGNLAVNVEKSNILTIIINEKMGCHLGVNPVQLKMQFIIKEREKNNFHSTVKPVALMEYLINMVTHKQSIVLDPFIGSGTTAVACKQLNRKYIGFELDPEYVNIANKRLEQNNLNDWFSDE